MIDILPAAPLGTTDQMSPTRAADPFVADGDEPDDATQNVLTLFVGVMFGVQAANKGVGMVAAKLAEQAVSKLPQKALTKGVVYPIVKRVAGQLGTRMTKGIFAKGVAKAIPVAGAVLSGGLTLATFLPMARRPKKHLASLEITRPHRSRRSVGPADDQVVPLA